MSDLSVLVVDDVPEIRKLISKILTSKGYYTIEAETGQEAVQLIRQDKSIALVLLDIMLPDMDGYQVMEQLKPLKEERRLKVCFVSGKKEKDAVIKAVSLGGDDYIVKPIFPDVLIEKVNLFKNHIFTVNVQKKFNSKHSNISTSATYKKSQPPLLKRS